MSGFNTTCTILSATDLFLSYRTLGPSNDFTDIQRQDLFAWCVRLSRLLVGFRTHFKSLHFHSFIHTSRSADNKLTFVLYETTRLSSSAAATRHWRERVNKCCKDTISLYNVNFLFVVFNSPELLTQLQRSLKVIALNLAGHRRRPLTSHHRTPLSSYCLLHNSTCVGRVPLCRRVSADKLLGHRMQFGVSSRHTRAVLFATDVWLIKYLVSQISWRFVPLYLCITIGTRCSAIAERPRCSVRYSFRQK